MIKSHNEVTWRIIPNNTPLLIRHCSKCNRKMEYYCSEKFRMNSNGMKNDVWIIYKCTKCDTTLKLTICSGVKPQDIPKELFDKFTHNDAELAWKYAFDRNFLKQHDCIVHYADVGYVVEGFNPDDLDGSLIVHLESLYYFDLKLRTFLSNILGISAGKLKKFVDKGFVTTDPVCDVMKYKIRSDFMVLMKPLHD